MTALLRLYPRTWRTRYEAEFLELLAARPLRLADRMDILLGALDAHLDPQVPDASDEGTLRVRRDRWSRLAGLSAVIGGAAWVAVAPGFLLAPFEHGSRDSTAGIVLALLGNIGLAGAMIGLVGTLARRVTAARWSALAMIAGTALMVLPWPIFALGLFLSFAASVAVGAVLISNGARWLGAALAAAAIAVFAINTENAQAAFAVPYGLIWIALGARLAAGTRWHAPERSGP
jgi:hypothetical protein